MIVKALGTVGLLLFSTVAIAGLYTVAENKAPSKESSKFQEKVNAETLNHIIDRIKQEYVEPVEDDKLLSGALNGMLSALDPHSAYLDPKSHHELQIKTKAEYGGLGMEVTQENGFVKVVSPIDDTPAFKAGLKSGDLIIAIDKKPVTGMTLNEAVDLLRGKPGTSVHLHVKREGKDVFEVDVARENIKVKSVKWRTEKDVGYIRISTFNESTVALLKEAISEIQKKLGDKLEGFVLDVRNDPGGLLDAAVEVSELFLPKGSEIVSTKGRKAEMEMSLKAKAKDYTNGAPIVVLINGGSASASEILAGAIQDNNRGIVVGTKSFGKGSVQVVMPLTNGGAIILTIARYYTPSGRSIQAKGIEPDIVIEQVEEKLEKVDEAKMFSEKDFEGALDVPEKKKEPASNDNEEKPGDDKAKDDEIDLKALGLTNDIKKKEVEDYQLMRAIDIVRTMALASKRQEKQACKK